MAILVITEESIRSVVCNKTFITKQKDNKWATLKVVRNGALAECLAWTVPQLSSMVVYKRRWSILIKRISVMIVT